MTDFKKLTKGVIYIVRGGTINVKIKIKANLILNSNGG